MHFKPIIVENKSDYEVRCNSCGKILFTFKKSGTDIDKKTQRVIIVAKCNRCKSNNSLDI